MSSWDLIGKTPKIAAGASGTVLLPPGAAILQIITYSTTGGTLTILGGASIPIVANAAPVTFDFRHQLFAAQGTGSGAQVVFTGTTMYVVHYVLQGNQ